MHFKYISQRFRKFTDQWNHDHNPVLEHLYHSKTISLLPVCSQPHSHCQSRSHFLLYSVYISACFLGVDSHNSSYFPVWLFSLMWWHYQCLLPSSAEQHSAFWIDHILFMNMLVDGLGVTTWFWLLIMVLLWTLWYRGLCGHV